MHGVYWTGPVSPHNLDAVKWSAPTHVVVVNKGVCSKGDTKCVSWTSFTDLAKSLPGNKLAALDAAASAPGPFATRTLCGFSAGGAFLEALLADKQTAPSIDAVLGLDCFYFKGDSPGLLAFAQRAAAGKALMVLTTSGSPDAGFLTPSEAVKPFVEKLGASTLSDSDADAAVGAMTPRPVLVQKVGRFYHLAFGTMVGHVDQARRVGPAVLQAIVSPQMAQQGGMGDGLPAPGGNRWLQAAAGAALLTVAIAVPVVAARAVDRNRRSGLAY